MFERFDDAARRAIVLSQEEARRVFDHNHIGTEHLLLGLIRGQDVGAEVLARLGVGIAEARKHVRSTIGQGQGGAGQFVPFTPRAKHVLELALREMLAHGNCEIGTEHLLLGLVAEVEGVAVAVLKELGVQPDAMRTAVLEAMTSKHGGPVALDRRERGLRARLTVVEALLVASDRRLEVVDVISEAPDVEAASASLETLLGISAENAAHVLGMRFDALIQQGDALRHERNTLRQQLENITE